MKVIKLSMLAATMLIAGMTTVKAQTADEIIQKHIDAIGGTDNWNKVKSMKKIGSMSIQGMEIGFTQTIVNEKGQRTDINAMGSTGYVIITPKDGWMYMPMQGMDKVTPLPAEQLKAAQGQLSIKAGMLVDKTTISKAEYIGKDSVNSMGCYKVKITDKDGKDQTDFFDMATYYLVHIETKAKNQEGEEQEVAMDFSNFQKQPEGIVIPMTQTSPMGQGDITYKSIEINKPVEDKTFVPDPVDKK